MDPYARFDLFYQPQMFADGSRPAAAEALLRVRDPDRGWVGPADHLPPPTDVEACEALDWWVLEHAMRDSRRWPDLTISINVSATQFRHADFAQRVLDLIARTAARPNRIEIEIVEAAIIEDFATATANITQLRAAGVGIALDDFGTGYSSLTYLLRIPLDKLKIDKCFIANLETVQSAAIVHALVALARAIGLKVTVEGVETSRQQSFLKAAGCHYLQGFLFHGALPVEQLTALLEASRPQLPRSAVA